MTTFAPTRVLALLVAVLVAVFWCVDPARGQDASGLTSILQPSAAPPAAETGTGPDEDAAPSEVAPPDTTQKVEFRGLPLFEVRAQLGPLTPAQRAAAIEDRLEKVVKAGDAVLDQVRAEDRNRSTELLAGDQYVMSVTDADARPTGRTRQQLAADYAVKLRAALAQEFRGRSARGLIIGAVVAIVSTLVFLAFLYYVSQVAPRLRAALRKLAMRHVGGLRFRGTELVPASTFSDGLVQVSRFLQLLVVLLGALVYLQVVLGAFPWTTELAVKLSQTLTGAFTLVATGLLDYVPNVFYIAVILFVTHYLLRFARIFFVAISRGSISVAGFYPEWAMPSFKILRFLAYAFAAVVIFPYLPGSGSPAFQGVSIFLGLLFSLGSTSAIANMVAGVVLTYMRPFHEGDRVKIADTIGDIIEKNLLVVRVRTIKNVDITIPNSMVLNNHIINFSSCAKEPGLILHSTVSIGYDVPWRQVHELLIGAAGRTAGIQAEPKPFVLQTSLDDFYVSYELNAYTEEPNQMAVIYSELHEHIQDAFNEAGVEIMSPHYTAARDGNQVAIPTDYLPKDYNPPAFRVLPVGPAGPAPGAGPVKP